VARLGRRQPFPPIIKTMIRFAPPEAPTPPAARAPYIISRGAIDAASSRYHVLSRTLTGLPVTFTAAAPAPPAAAKPLVVSFESIAHSIHRSHTLRRAQIILPPVVDQGTPRIRPAYKVVHDEKAEHAQSRVHEQQVSDILNNLLITGQLRGTTKQPILYYYVPADNLDWGGNPPSSFAAALDRIAAALAANGIVP
jgi:hypothetical protein